MRQLVSRARKHIADERRQPAGPTAQKALLTSFIAAARSGDMAALERLFAADVTSMSDGNGMVRVSRRPVTGATRVARFMTAISTWFWDDVELQWVTTNGQSSVVVIRDGPVFGADDVASLVAELLCGQPCDELTVEAVNGGAGPAQRRDGRALAVVAVRTAYGRVLAIWIVVNPAKLSAWHRR